MLRSHGIVFIGLFLSVSLNAQDIESPVFEPSERETVVPQEAEESAGQDEKDEESAGQDEKDEVVETKNEPDFDVFRPSEDISEDLAVPFPVDI